MSEKLPSLRPWFRRPGPPAVFPPLDGEPNFDTALCHGIEGRDRPRKPAIMQPEKPTARPLFDPSA
jgi:hypothetical protein